MDDKEFTNNPPQGLFVKSLIKEIDLIKKHNEKLSDLIDLNFINTTP